MPRDGKDRQRAAAREGTHLGDGRPVLERTTKNRAYLLGLFAQWLGQAGLTLEELLDPKKADTEVLKTRGLSTMVASSLRAGDHIGTTQKRLTVWQRGGPLLRGPSKLPGTWHTRGWLWNPRPITLLCHQLFF